MFERHTDKARRAIFFARYEASLLGSPRVEAEHLLLGLVREDKSLTKQFLQSDESLESIRRRIEQHTPARERLATSVDLPMSQGCKTALAYAAEEADGSRIGLSERITYCWACCAMKSIVVFAAALLASFPVARWLIDAYLYNGR